MAPERWRQVKKLFDSAVELAPGDRAGLLAEQCGDAEVRAEVERLLRQHDAAGDFLEKPAINHRVLSPGELLDDRFKIVRLVGRGGMGEVYEAHDTRLDRRVALKFLPEEFAFDHEALERFEREARAIAALNHPHICTIYDTCTHDESPFLVMEFVEGETLEHRLKKGALPLDQALRCAIEIAGALDQAHRHGIIHRDLKPANIMLTAAGTKVLDFGVAKMRGTRLTPTAEAIESTALTETGAVVGTPRYMAPEQMKGAETDARTDIFAFGAVLYEMLTGTKAFPGESQASLIGAIIQSEPVPVMQVQPLASDTLDHVIRRCLAKDPDLRWQTALDLTQELHWVAEQEPQIKRQPAAPRRDHHITAWVLGSLAVVLAAVVIRMAPHSAKVLKPEFKPLTSYSGSEARPSFSPDGNQVAFSWNGEKQDNYDIYVKVVDGGTPLRLTTNPTVDGAPAWSPDGRLIAFVRDTSEVFLISPLGGPERKLTNAKGFFVSWAPDSKTIAIADSNSDQEPYSIFLVSIATGERRRVTNPPEGYRRLGFGDYASAFSPDGKMLAFVRRSEMGSDLYVTPLEGKEPRRLTVNPQPIFGLAWTPDGREIVYSANRLGHESLWRIPMRASEGTEPEPIQGVEGEARYPAICGAGPGHSARLAYQRTVQDINIWRAELLELPPVKHRKLSPPARLIFSTRRDEAPQLSPDGRRIAFVSDRSGTYAIWLADSDGSSQIQLTYLPGYCGSPRWSPNGQHIAFDYLADGNRDIYTIGVNGGGLLRLTNEPSIEARPSWSHDSRWIYFRSDRSGTQQIWKMPAGGGTPTQVTRGGGFEPFESPDGKRLYYVKGYAENSVWSVPVDGGEETNVVEPVVQGHWTVQDNGIYFIKSRGKRLKMDFRDEDTPRFQGSIELYNPATHNLMSVGAIFQTITPGPSFSVSHDGRWALWSQVDQTSSDLGLIENFR